SPARTRTHRSPRWPAGRRRGGSRPGTRCSTGPWPPAPGGPSARSPPSPGRRGPPGPAPGTRPRWGGRAPSGYRPDLLADPPVALLLERRDQLRPALLDDPPFEHDVHELRLDQVQDALVVGDDQRAE